MPFGKKPWKKKQRIATYQPVSGEGPIPAKLMIVGERPGIDEDNQGRPFVGISGQELDRYIESVGIRREDCYITNLVKVYADHSPKADEVREWEELLRSEIDMVEPSFIAAVGAHSVKWFLGNVALEDVHGIPQYWDKRTVTPIYHPASAFYDPEQGKFVQYDFQMWAQTIAGKLVPIYDQCKQVKYVIERPNISPWADLIAIDTEGSREHPWCLTWSTIPGEAYCHKEVQKGWRPIGHILLHNSLHDLSVLRTMGTPLDDDGFTDTMVLAYLLGVEPQGLKPLARRHAGMEMLSYDDLLADANRSMALEYLAGLSGEDWGESEPYCIIKGGTIKVTKPWSLNRYIENIIKDCTEGKNVNGEYKPPEEIDPRKRWNDIDPTVTRRAVDSFGDMPEATLDDIPEDEAIAYACRDADATLRIYPILRDRVTATGQDLVAEIDHSIIPMVDRMQQTGFMADPDHFDQLADKCDAIMAAKVQAIKDLTGAEINPDSPDQVRALLFDQLGLEPIKWTKGGKSGDKKESTQDKVIEALRFEHPACGLVADFREASKVKSSFCIPIRRRALASADRRIRCNLRITRVSSGRLAANSPNLMAIPIRTELGREVRNGFVAPPGKVLATWDLNQVEMRHMAYESQEPALVHIFRDTDHDVHIETTARMFGRRPYDEVYNLVKVLKDKAWDARRMGAKRVGFGVITGITGHGLKEQMALQNALNERGLPWTEEECDDLIESWFGEYGGVRSYMDGCRAEARRYGFARDMWGRIRYLPSVHSHIERISEEACRQSHSHKIQAGAQGIMKVAMAAIWKELKEVIWPSGWYAEPLLQIHDELVWELDDDPVLWEIMDEMMVRNLTTAHLAYFPEYNVPLKAGGDHAYRWGELK